MYVVPHISTLVATGEGNWEAGGMEWEGDWKPTNQQTKQLQHQTKPPPASSHLHRKKKL